MNVKSLLVAGGGTAGLIAAIILKKNLNIQIDVVYSSNIGIIGVGEGSTEHFKEFMEFVGIDQYDLIKNCDATYKSGIMFENWTEQPYLHSVGSHWSTKNAQYAFIYASQIAKKDKKITDDLQWQNKINKWFLNRSDQFPYNQFHFNTHKLNEYLTNFAKSLGINFYDDEIKSVNINEQGHIQSLIGNTNEYRYDFYIDSTGFKRILMDQLGAKWQSYGKYLKMKSAITFQTPDEDNYNLWTVARAMDAGWMFRIPVWGRYGNGYIFDSDYIDKEHAHKEVERLFNKEVEIGKQFYFDPGALDRVWINNCVAIGLSGSFVEPLEATSIGTSIQQSFLLMHRLQNYNQNIINDYNKSFNDIMENIRDFLVLHYMTRKTNTQFWRDLSNLEIPDSLGTKLERWQHKLPINEDFSHLSNYRLFNSDNFIMCMHGLDLFDHNSIKQEFDSKSILIHQETEKLIQQYEEFSKNVHSITHKEMINLIRNYF
jgi:tryptophan halogenase